MPIARHGLVIANVFLVIAASSQDINFDRVGQLGGTCRDQAVSNGHAYIGVGPNVVVLDLTNPSLPAEIARIALDDTVNAIVVSGNRAVVATSAPFVWSGAKTTVLDITDPANPAILGVHATTYVAKILAIKGDYCLAAKEDGKMDILDVSPADGPDLLGTLSTIYTSDIAIEDDLALLAGGYGSFQILDISNLPTVTPVATYPTSDNCFAIAADGDRVAIARFKAIDIFSIADPAYPSLLGTVPEVWVVYGVAMSGSIVYAGTQYEIHSIDISNLANPVQLHKTYDARVSSNTRFSVQGTSLYLCNYPVGFQIVDVANPSYLYTRGRFDTGIAPISVAVSGNMAATGATSRGPYLLDVSDALGPEVLGNSESSGGASDIEWYEGRVFIASSSGLAAWEVIANEPRYGYLFLAQGCNEVEFNGHYAYINDQSAALRVLDASVPKAPALLGSAALTSYPRQFGLTRTHAYVSYSGLRSYGIVDVTDPLAPIRVTDIATSNPVNAIAATGNRIFVGYSTGDILEYEVEDALDPQLTGYASAGSGISRLYVFGNLLFANPTLDGPVAFDISQPGVPQFLGAYRHRSYDFAVHDGLVYVAGGDRGLDVIECTEGLPTVPAPTRVQASDGEPADTVRITWDRMAGADAYDVWRAEPNQKGPVHLARTDFTELYDTPWVANTFAYWVTATYDGIESAASSSDTGFITLPPPTVLQVSPTGHTVTADAGEVEYLVENTGNPELLFAWTAEVVSGDWLQVQNGQSGKSGEVCRVAYDANDTYVERTGTIRITSPGAENSPLDVTVVQQGLVSDPQLSVSPDSQEISHLGGAAAFDIRNSGTGLMAWFAEVESGDWVSIVGDAAGDGDAALHVNVAKNDSSDERVASLRISAPGTPQEFVTVQIRQSGKGWIQVISPNGAEQWRRGDVRKIRWDHVGECGPRVFIELWRNGKWVQSVTGDTKNDGKYNWTIPGDLRKKAGYSIRIVSLYDETMYDVSDELFAIRKPASP